MDKTIIFNIALMRLGAPAALVGEFDSSAERTYCERAWETACLEVLSLHPWAFARKFATLARRLDLPAHPKFKYAYQFPEDCLAKVRIDPEAAAFELAGNAIYTDAPALTLVYTAKVTEATRFPAYCATLLALRIAAIIAPAVRNGSSEAVRLIQQFYDIELPRAVAADMQQSFYEKPKTKWREAIR